MYMNFVLMTKINNNQIGYCDIQKTKKAGVATNFLCAPDGN